MTDREAYVMGFVYGKLESALGRNYDPAGVKFSNASMRPISGLATIHRTVMAENKMSEKLSIEIAAALDEIGRDVADGSPQETVIPLELQGKWQLGYYKGKDGGSS